MSDGMRPFTSDIESRLTQPRPTMTLRSQLTLEVGPFSTLADNPWFLYNNYNIASHGVIFFAGNVNLVPFATKLKYVPITAVSTNRVQSAAAGDRNIAFSLGGYLSGIKVTADKFPWATQLCSAQTSADLTTAGTSTMGSANADMVLATGWSTAGSVLYASKTLFSTWVTASQASAVLSFYRTYGQAGADDIDSMLFGGLVGGTVAKVEADTIDWSTLTTAADPYANLTEAKNFGGCVGNYDYQVIAGGYKVGQTTTTAYADRMAWATHITAGYSSANLTSATVGFGSCNNFDEGMFLGGTAPGISDKVNLSTQVTSAISPALTFSSAAMSGAANR